MPMYNNLRIAERDSEARKAEKRRIAERLLVLRKELRKHTGEEVDGVRTERDPRQWMRLATWNIREFPSSKYGDRLPEAYYYIAEILSHFDVIAVQEIREDLAGLRRVMRILGPGWDYIATDVCEGSGGNGERMVFVFNTHKAFFRNVAGELVLSSSDEIAYPHEERLSWRDLEIELPSGTRLEAPEGVVTKAFRGRLRLDEEVPIELPPGTKLVLKNGSRVVLPRRLDVELDGEGRLKLPTTRRVSYENRTKHKVAVDLPAGAIVGEKLQFARQPLVVGLQSGWLRLMLCTVHIYYGKGGEKDPGMARRKREIRALTKLLGERAESAADSDASNFFIVLGDFNIVSREHGTMDALRSNGFEIPPALTRIPGSNVDKTKHYDQIAVWTAPEGSKRDDDALGVVKVEAGRAGVFDFFKYVFRRGAQDPDDVDATHYQPLMDEMREQSGSSGKWDYKDWRTYQMSDHLPMWVELRIDFGDDYLEAIDSD